MSGVLHPSESKTKRKSKKKTATKLPSCKTTSYNQKYKTKDGKTKKEDATTVKKCYNNNTKSKVISKQSIKLFPPYHPPIRSMDSA